MIDVVDYDPVWAARFVELRSTYEHALTHANVPVVAIEHVGSTAVPGLAAKPIIDCDIVVAERHVPAASRVLEDLGFTPLGELGIPQRWAFKEPKHFAATNTYIVVGGCLSLRNHLAVRDTLRVDAVLRDEYGAVKRAIAATAADIDEYGQRKSDIVQIILAAAGLSAEERHAIGSNQVPSHHELPR